MAGFIDTTMKMNWNDTFLTTSLPLHNKDFLYLVKSYFISPLFMSFLC